MSHALAITPGDPTGIGPEIVARMLADPPPGRPVVYGDRRILDRAAAIVGSTVAWHEVDDPRQVAPPGTIPLVSVPWTHGDLPDFGRIDARAGAHALEIIERAGRDALAGKLAGLVTAPINKQAILPTLPAFIGHTEFLAELAGADDFGMLLVVDDFRVLHVTTHMSVRDAIDALTPALICKTIRLAARSLPRLGLAGGTIGVTALNPHAGEGGRFGREEIEIIGPACDQVRAEGLDVEGPLPPDTVFYRARQGHFAMIVAMLHDQGHIPLKMWGMDRGVNTTIGLPFVRTSVDHGTAFDLAGTGKADAGSLRHAWDLAARLVTTA
ncbi:MAG: 4-hydroxythreonine-4-phosphate dehydrogenase [Cyanobacteria bacterium RYN_339]|nr:4-hydroxythreonine-4-phosphate dehydrogenase [Cyanobacteria bacterium RYN_339]